MSDIDSSPTVSYCDQESIGYDPQDIEATMGWMLTALKERDAKALDDLFWKVRVQIDALEEDYTARLKETK